MNYRNVLFISFIFLMFAVANVNAGWTTNPSERSYYFIEHDENGNPLADGSIWVNGSFSNTTFYVYYNGDSDSGYENGDKVFEFFDDFDYPNNALNTTKWTCVDNTCAVSNSIGSQASPTTAGTYGMRTNSVYDKNDNFHFYCKIQEANYGFFGTQIRDVGGDGSYDIKQYVYNSANGGWITSTYVASNPEAKVSATGYANYFKAEMRQYGTSYVEFYHNGNLITNHTAKIPLTDGYIFILGLKGKYVYCDWLFNSLRNTYTTSYGSEEAGSWEIDGITYTKRKEVEMTGTFDGQIELDYGEFSSENITITTFSGGTPASTITFISQDPADLTSVNIIGGVNITYNFTNATAGDVKLEVVVNATDRTCLFNVMGTCYEFDETFNENYASQVSWFLADNDLLPSHYFVSEDYIENTAKTSNYTINNDNTYIKYPVYNISTLTEDNYIEIMAYRTAGTQDLRVYYCNESYSTGNPVTNDNCALATAFTNFTWNHEHSEHSKHIFASLPNWNATGNISDVVVTESGYFLIRGRGAGHTFQVPYITNSSANGIIEVTTNNGVTWSNLGGYIDSHIHTFTGEEDLNYRACYQDDSECSAWRNDSFDLDPIPPIPSYITTTLPDKVYGTQTLAWSDSSASYGTIDYYNVTFIGDLSNEAIYNGANLLTTWDVSSITNQEGYIQVEVCNTDGLCTYDNSELFNITNFNVTINEPSVNATFTNNTYFEFERDGNYNLWCDLYADDVIIRSKSLTSGTNIWNATLNLDGYDDLRVDCNIIGYTSIMSTFNYSINITEVPYILDYEMTLTEYGSVYDASQVLFYDHNGYLNLLFFSVLSSTDYLNVLVLNGSDILYEHQEPLDLTMSYINVFLEPNQTTLLLVNSTGNGIHWVNVTDTSMTIDTEAFGDFTIVDRTDKFEPAQLVNTHGNVGVAGGYFVVGLPSSTTNYKMYRKNVSDNTLTYLSKDVRGYSVSSSLKSSDFLEWYVAGGDSASTSNLRLDYYNSTAWVNVYSTDVGTEVFTNVNYKTKVRFTENNIFLTQMGSSARPLKILNLTSATGHYTSNIQVYNNTLPIYVTDDIFVMLLNSNAGERYYVCEGQDSITCDVVTPSDYGFTVPFTNYPLSANYINSNGINKVTYGKTFSGYPFTFNYNENVYDAKFQCLDEMEEHNLDFVFTVSTDTTNNQLATKLIGYVIPSSIMPSGRKDFNVLCDTSVYRKYYLGLDTNYLMNFYGLNESDGLYYTIEVIDAFSNPIPGVLISAKRYSGGELSLVTIEQGVTDTNGNVILFLEPTILYKINVIDLSTKILITEFDLVPGTTTNIQLKVDTSKRLNLDDPSEMFDDVVWLLTPKPTTFRNSTEVEYSVSSASSSLEYSGFYITKTNATGSYVVYNNSGTSPTTQTYSYLFNETGKYEMTTYFKHSNYSAFFSHYSYIYAGNSTFILAQESFEDFNISGWAYFLIVLVVVGMVMGYVSHYSWEGASAVGILVMWAMVIFAPSDMTLVSRGVGTPYEFTISLIHVVSILTLLVGVLLFRRYRA